VVVAWAGAAKVVGERVVGARVVVVTMAVSRR